MKNLYRKHLEIKYKGDVSLDNLTTFKNLHQLEFMGSLPSEEMEAIEIAVLDRKLSHDERRVERQILSSVTIIHSFISKKIEELDQNYSDVNRFYRLNESQQKTCLEYLYEIRKDDMKRARLYVVPLQKMGVRIETIPQKYFDMSLEELKTEIDNWRWPTIS